MNPPILVLNNPAAPRLSPELAQEIGLNESILLLQIEFWIRTSTTAEREGRRWTYQSTRDIQELFPFWGAATIQRTVQSLLRKNLVQVGNFNRHRYDRTRWFALNGEGLARLKSITVAEPFQNGTSSFQNGTRSDQNGTRSPQNGTTIPESTTESTTENNSRGSTGTAATSIFLIYEQNIGRLSPPIIMELKKAEKEVPVDWIRDAIEEAVVANVRKWNYVKAILNRWKVEGREERREILGVSARQEREMRSSGRKLSWVDTVEQGFALYEEIKAKKSADRNRHQDDIIEWAIKGIYPNQEDAPRDQRVSAIDVTPRV